MPLERTKRAFRRPFTYFRYDYSCHYFKELRMLLFLFVIFLLILLFSAIVFAAKVLWYLFLAALFVGVISALVSLFKD